MGLDVGDKRLGVALSDPQGILASPLTIINCAGGTADLEAIVNIVDRYQVERIVVGLPRSMDGSLGKQAEKVKAFTEDLSSRTEVPIVFRDERLSTVSAKRLMRPVRTGKARRKARHDAVAAAIILQAYLDEGRPLAD
jgi:putative Holliday junction resolvase